MSESHNHLIREFEDQEYRQAYAEDFLDTYLASQITVLREQRGMTQEQLAQAIGTQQPGIARIENVNYSRWNIGTLKRIAAALGVRLKVSLETFGSLIDEASTFDKGALMRPPFEDDPVFSRTGERHKVRPESQPQPLFPSPSEDDPIAVVQRAVFPWLEESEPETERLAGWLQGYGLPPVGAAEEPYLWLLRAMPLDPSAASAYRAKIAASVARLLAEAPDAHRPGKRPDKLLYNLFYLAAGLESEANLADPLFAVYRRLADGEAHLDPDVAVALTAALIRNQIDSRLKPEWDEMVAYKRHAVLPGNEYTGLAGLRRKPPSKGEAGRPDLKSLGWALKQMAGHMEERQRHDPSQDPRGEFGSLVQQIKDLFPGEPNIDADLIVQADENEWPRWAMEALPNLFARLGDGHVLVWLYALACVPGRLRFEVCRELCDRQVIEITAFQETEAFLELVCPRVEHARLANPGFSARSMIGVVAHTLQELQLQLEAAGQRGTSSDVRTAHRRLLVEHGIIGPEDLDAARRRLVGVNEGKVPDVGALTSDVLGDVTRLSSHMKDVMSVRLRAASATFSRQEILEGAKDFFPARQFEAFQSLLA